MPKKFKGENSKAVEARARKAAAKHEEADRRQKAVEDEYWRDDDKHANRKMQRKVSFFLAPLVKDQLSLCDTLSSVGSPSVRKQYLVPLSPP